MEVRMVKGSERNLKITTIEDLETFETILKGDV
jgi:2-C-methyl-D-erythritol 4-phosphate cytidylyltransferase